MGCAPTPMTWPREQRFTITDDHLKLLARLEFEYDPSIEFGAPAVDPKRPYGNSDVYGDMRKILGLPEYDEDDSWNLGAQEQLLDVLHREMATVLQIIARTGRVQAGDYDARKYFNDWKPVDVG